MRLMRLIHCATEGVFPSVGCDLGHVNRDRDFSSCSLAGCLFLATSDHHLEVGEFRSEAVGSHLCRCLRRIKWADLIIILSITFVVTVRHHLLLLHLLLLHARFLRSSLARRSIRLRCCIDQIALNGCVDFLSVHQILYLAHEDFESCALRRVAV